MTRIERTSVCRQAQGLIPSTAFNSTLPESVWPGCVERLGQGSAGRQARGCVYGAREKTRRPHSTPLALVFAFILLGFMFVPGSEAARKVREKMRLKEPTGQANPKLEHIEFDPFLAEIEQEKDDIKWLENYRKKHHAEEAAVEAALLVDSEGTIVDASAKEVADAFAEEIKETFHEALQMPGMEEDIEGLTSGDHEPEDFLFENHFNITDRIIQLFPEIDHYPSDGKLSLEELTIWHLALERASSMHRTMREMEGCDANGDGRASLEEALVAMGVEKEDQSNHDQRTLYIERFRLADMDHDKVLNVSEFNDFLHPEESKNQGLQRSLLLEEFRHRDMDGDHRISLSEFEHTTYSELQHRLEVEKDPVGLSEGQEEPEHEAEDGDEKPNPDAVKRMFSGFDTDKDGYITEDEFKAIMKHIWLDQEEFARLHAEEIIRQADKNDDKKLQLEEMLGSPHVFYQTVEDRQSPKHDEF